jgi:hypothetical protein
MFHHCDHSWLGFAWLGLEENNAACLALKRLTSSVSLISCKYLSWGCSEIMNQEKLKLYVSLCSLRCCDKQVQNIDLSQFVSDICTFKETQQSNCNIMAVRPHPSSTKPRTLATNMSENYFQYYTCYLETIGHFMWRAGQVERQSVRSTPKTIRSFVQYLLNPEHKSETPERHDTGTSQYRSIIAMSNLRHQ